MLNDTYVYALGKIIKKGRITDHGKLASIKFIVGEDVRCIAYGKYALLANSLDLGTTVIVEGTISTINNQNVIHVDVLEIYNTPKVNKEFEDKVKGFKPRF